MLFDTVSHDRSVSGLPNRVEFVWVAAEQELQSAPADQSFEAELQDALEPAASEGNTRFVSGASSSDQGVRSRTTVILITDVRNRCLSTGFELRGPANAAALRLGQGPNTTSDGGNMSPRSRTRS